MILTRNLINKNIKIHDFFDHSIVNHYDYNHLSSLIDAYKNMFIAKGAKKDRSVVIGTQARIEQFALVFACAELGMNVTIVANPTALLGNGTEIIQSSAYTLSAQYKAMMPVDFFVVCSLACTEKFQIFKNTCRQTIIIKDETLDYTPNDTIFATDDTVFLRCPSSGTTGLPKVIQHTHNFFSQLIQRNSKMYYGTMGMLNNLNHGSSPGTYFLPGLVSDNVTDVYNIICGGDGAELANILKNKNISLDHVMFSYTKNIESLFDSEETLGNAIIYTLGIIRQQWVDKLKGKVKDIISIFGSNETSGPTLINQATDSDFAENKYKKLDDFYDLTLSTEKLEFGANAELKIKMPIYNTTIPTNDLFKLQDNKYVHLGRSNLFRINDVEVNVLAYQKIIDANLKGELIVDTTKDRIYVAIWDKLADPSLMRRIDNKMRTASSNMHYISKYECLNYDDFLNGVKLDKEALREYFRNKF